MHAQGINSDRHAYAKSHNHSYTHMHAQGINSDRQYTLKSNRRFYTHMHAQGINSQTDNTHSSQTVASIPTCMHKASTLRQACALSVTPSLRYLQPCTGQTYTI
eukprot:1162125-Pelagomonas_calceolata.AAC.9